MITVYLCASLTMLLAFAVLIIYHYVADLRAENKRLRENNQSAWEDFRSRQTATSVATVPVPKWVDDTTPLGTNQPAPFSFSGIGITQIRDRELRQQREREAETQPRFDKSALVEPSEQEIIAAAKKATGSVN